MNVRKILLLLAIFATLRAGAAQIDRSQARIVAQEFIDIEDTASDDVAPAPYYIFSRGAGKGFVIVSGDDAIAPILGYTDQGDYDESQLPIQLKTYLQAWEEKITKLQQQNAGVKSSDMTPTKARRRLVLPSYKSAWKDVPVIVPTHWNQGRPYNLLAPYRTDNGNQALTGCLATAASQILYYFRKDNPKTTLYDTPTYGYGGAPITVSIPKGTPINYGLMKLSGSGSARQDSAVAVLMYVAGTSSWLTYGMGEGTATGGQCEDMGKALRGQFNLNNDYVGKWNYSQQGWETLVYNNLASGRPMLYCGANESQGGHAVILDGYQASTGLYHFNFGWGGQGDGYFTVDDETGMNGFNSSQTMLANITPKNQDYSATIQQPVLYERTSGQIQVLVRNNATLPQSKFYLYCSTTNTIPSSPSASDETTVVPSGDSAVISFTYRPIYAKLLNILLYDANGNLLDKTAVDVLPATPDLSLDAAGIDASSDVTTKGDIAFRHLYNTTANISARFTNSSEGTTCQPTLRCSIFEYDENSGTWAADSTVKSITTLQFQTGETRDTIFQFKNLKQGAYYKAHVVPVASTSNKFPIKVNTPDSLFFFRVFAPDLAVTTEGRHAKVKGHWNHTLFTSAASSDLVTTYDLTAVDGLSSQPVAANPNALFYLKNDVEGGVNTIVDGRCRSLVIDADNEFAPLAAFRADRASFRLPAFSPAVWNVTSLPFDAEVPFGMQARILTGMTTVKMLQQHVTTLKAGDPVAYLSSSPHVDSFTATDVTVRPDTLYTSLGDTLAMATVRTKTAEKSMMLGVKLSVPYFLNADADKDVPPFTCVLNTRAASGIRLFSESTVDRYYTVLADTLVSACNALDATPHNPRRDDFAALVKAYTNAFTTYNYADHNAIKASAKEMGDIIALFLAGEELPSGIPSVEDNRHAIDNSVRYYSIDGTPLQAPRRGLIIVRQGNKVRKMMVRN